MGRVLGGGFSVHRGRVFIKSLGTLQLMPLKNTPILASPPPSRRIDLPLTNCSRTYAIFCSAAAYPEHASPILVEPSVAFVWAISRVSNSLGPERRYSGVACQILNAPDRFFRIVEFIPCRAYLSHPSAHITPIHHESLQSLVENRP